MNAGQASGRQLLGQFVASLEKVTGKDAVVEPAADADAPFDGVVRLDSGLAIAYECKQATYPRDIREAVFKLREQQGRADTIVLLSPHMTQASRALIREHGFGYFDGSGSMHIEVGDTLIHVDRPSPKQATRRAQSIYTGANGQVVLALLEAREEWRTGSELALHARTSAFTVSQTVNELARLELLETKAMGRVLLRRLVHAGKVLDAWEAATRSRSEETSHGYLFAQDTTSLLRTVTEKIRPLAGVLVTGAAAANHHAPWLTDVDVIDLLVPPGESPSVFAQLGLKPVTSGFNVRLIERATSGDAKLASPFVAYADTLNGRGRNKELAQHLRSTVLKVDDGDR